MNTPFSVSAARLLRVQRPSFLPRITLGMWTGAALWAATNPASAANVTLTATDASGQSSFNTAGHWNNGAAPAAGNAYFTGAFLLRSPADNVSRTFAGDSLSIDAGGGRFVLKNNGTNGAGVLTINSLIFNGGVIDEANASGDSAIGTIAGTVTATANTTTALGALASETLRLNSTISGSGNLQIGGPNANAGADTGTVRLSGANTAFSGSIAVGSTNASGANAILQGLNTGTSNVLQAFGIGTITLNNAAGSTGTTTLQLRADGSGSTQSIVTGDGTTGNNVVVAGDATIDVNRNAANTGNTFVFNNLSIGTNTLNVTGGNGDGLRFSGTTSVTGAATFNPTTAPLTLTNVTVDDSVATGTTTTVTLGGTATASVVSGALANNATDGTKVLALTKSGAGTWSLTGANTYTGATNISAGVLQIGNGGMTGSLSPSSAITVTGTTSFLNFNRSNTVTQGTDFANVIRGTGVLQQVGTGNLVLSNTNTYTGATAIFGGGTITASSLGAAGAMASSLGAAPATGTTEIRLGGNSATGTLVYTGTGETTPRNFNLSAGSAGSDGIVSQSGTGALVFTGGVTHSGTIAHTLTFQGSTAGTGEVQGAIVDGTGTGNTTSIVKAGTGQWTFSGTNTYTGGTAINGGILAATGNGSLGGTTNVSVNAGGALLLSGSTTINTRINNAATVTLAGGTFALASVAEGGGGNGGLSTDGTVGTGALTLTNNSVIDLQGTSLLHAGASGSQVWTGRLSIYNWSGSATGNGLEQLLFGTDDSATSLTATQLSQISFYSDAGQTFLGNAQFAGLGDGEIIPASVPEPSTMLISLLVLGFTGIVQRRRLAAWLRLERQA